MEDELVQLAERSVNATNEGGNPGSMLVDFFPVCTSLFFVFAFCSARTGADGETRTSVKKLPTWMPGAGFKRDAFRNEVDRPAIVVCTVRVRNPRMYGEDALIV